MTNVVDGDTQAVRQGRCLCGGVQFTTRGEPVIVAHCHCEDCQRLTGAGHSTGAMFAVADVSLEGTTAQHQLQSNLDNTVTRVFCPGCGSPVYGHNSSAPEFMTLSLGLFDDASSFVPEVTIFARNRQPWDVMDNSIETFSTQPAWQPD